VEQNHFNVTHTVGKKQRRYSTWQKVGINNVIDTVLDCRNKCWKLVEKINGIVVGRGFWRNSKMKETLHNFKWMINTVCYKKSFTTLKAYRNIYRGHTQRFELSKCSKTHRVLPTIVVRNCFDLFFRFGLPHYQWKSH
jgi:hypothetical protein